MREFRKSDLFLEHKRKISKISLLLVFFLITIAFLSNTTSFMNSYENEYEDKYENINYNGINRCPDSSTAHSPIKIIGNAAVESFFAGNGSKGTSWATAYMIQNMEIDGGGTESPIHIENSDRFIIIENCTLINANSDSGYANIYLKNSTNVKIYNCSLSLTDDGINFNNCSNNIVQNNSIYDLDGNAIIISRSYENIIIQNNISHNDNYGIEGDIFSEFNLIIKNNISFNRAGVSLFDSGSNYLINNSIFNNSQDGIHLFELNNSFISANNLYNNTKNGITLSGTRDSNITANSIYNNKESGIFAVGPNVIYNQIENNIIQENIRGIDFLLAAEYNNIIANNFVGNKEYNAYTRFINYWHNFSIGNYWSDYSIHNPSASDIDGIWNIPYKVNESHSEGPFYDNFPLVSPATIDYHPYAEFIPDSTNILTGDDIKFEFLGFKGDKTCSFEWNFGDGSMISTDENPTHTYNSVGTFEVSLKLTDSDGDKSIKNHTIVVELNPFHDPILIDGNNVLDDFCETNGTTGLTWTSAHVIDDYNFSMEGTGTAIKIMNTDRFLKIDNCTIFGTGSNNDAGITLQNCSNVKITNCTIYENEKFSIFLNKSSKNSIENNNLTKFNAGIYIKDSYNNTIYNNSISSFKSGVTTNGFLLDNSSSNCIINNTIKNNSYGLLFEDLNHFNNISGNNILNSCESALKNEDSFTWNRIIDNNITNNYRGIRLTSGADNNTISNNSIINNKYRITTQWLGDGIYIYGISNNITDNYIRESNYGIMSYTDKNCFKNNTVIYNEMYGFYLRESFQESIFSENEVAFNKEDGFYLSGELNNNLFTKNYIHDNNQNGMNIYGADNNVITKNRFENNNGNYAIRSYTGANNNEIYLNDFLGNKGVYDLLGTNSWDNGSIGNYWFDYETEYPDAINNGYIWLTEYEIDHNSGTPYDRYPSLGYCSIDTEPEIDFINNDSTIIVGQTVQFNFTGNIGNYPAEYEWNFGDGTPISYGKDPIHTFYELGWSHVTLTVTDGDGDTSTSTHYNEIFVEEDITPIAEYTCNDTSILEGESIHFEYTGPYGNSPYVIKWIFEKTGLLTSANGLDFIITLYQAGVYNFTLNITDADGDSDEIFIENYIIVGEDISPIACLNASETDILEGDTVQFEYNGTFGNNPHSFNWDFGDGETSTEQDPAHQYINAGNYDVQVTITDNDGDEDSYILPVQISVGEVLPNALFVSNTTEIDEGEYIQFTFNGDTGNNPATYEWDFGDGSVNSTIQNPIHRFTTLDTFTVILTITDFDGDIDVYSAIDLILVNDIIPSVDFGTNATKITINGFIEFDFIGNYGGEELTFEWDFGDDSLNSSLENPIHQYASAGNYTVTLTVYDDDSNMVVMQKTSLIQVENSSGTGGSGGTGGTNNENFSIEGYHLFPLFIFGIITVIYKFRSVKNKSKQKETK